MNYWDVHSFGLPGSGVQKKTCCWLFTLLSPSHMGWQALGVWWDTLVCAHVHAFVCQGELDGVIMRTLQLL